VVFKGSPVNTVGLGVGVLLGSIGVGQLFTQWVLIRPLVARFGERKLVLLGDVLRGIGFLTMTVFVSPWLVGPVSLMSFAIGSGMMMPALQALTTTSVPEEISGGVLGVYQSSTSLGIILGSALSGWLFAMTPTMPYLVGGVIFALLVPPALMLMRQGQAAPVVVKTSAPA
jgi:predicted MFS family arabinose efflux permease